MQHQNEWLCATSLADIRRELMGQSGHTTWVIKLVEEDGPEKLPGTPQEKRDLVEHAAIEVCRWWTHDWLGTTFHREYIGFPRLQFSNTWFEGDLTATPSLFINYSDSLATFASHFHGYFNWISAELPIHSLLRKLATDLGYAVYMDISQESVCLVPGEAVHRTLDRANTRFKSSGRTQQRDFLMNLMCLTNIESEDSLRLLEANPDRQNAEDKRWLFHLINRICSQSLLGIYDMENRDLDGIILPGKSMNLDFELAQLLEYLAWTR